LNIDQHTAVYNKIGYRQIYPRQSPIDVNSLAQKILPLVIERKDDEKLKWYPGKNKVRILIGKIIPDDSAVEATLIGRRKRFRKALKKLLDEEGWVEVGVHTYAHTSII
jgi:hypothetical protein